MRVSEWEFADRNHPVYGRPEEAANWQFGPAGMRPLPYHEDEQGTVTEDLRMEMEGHPSVDIYQAPSGSTIQSVQLHSKYSPEIDLKLVEAAAREWYEDLTRLSFGPYSLSDLREMGHPYGYGDKREPYTWERLHRPRAIPRMGAHLRSMGYRKGMPDRSVVNRQSGRFSESWNLRVLRWMGGVNVLFINSAPYSWFLAHGTYKMQAHGPWPYAATYHIGALMKAWRLAAYRAWREGVQRARNAEAAMQGQFGEEAQASADLEAEAGGFS